MKDKGVYQAKVMSAAGECFSSPITVEVEPGPEWEGVTTGFINSIHREQNKPCLVVSTYYGAGLTTTGCISGTVGSWEVRKSPQEREFVEQEGKLALHAESERKKLAKWLLQQPFPGSSEKIEQCRTDSMQFAVTDAVRDALFNIWVKQDLKLEVQLKDNYKDLCWYMSGDCHWPSRSLISSPKKFLVETTLNHTRETHLEWEQYLADDWKEAFEYKFDRTIRWQSNPVPRGGGFRSKRKKPKHLTLDPETSSSDSWQSSDSMSSSDSEEEGLSKGVEKTKEEEIMSGLDKLLLSHHDEDQVPK